MAFFLIVLVCCKTNVRYIESLVTVDEGYAIINDDDYNYIYDIFPEEDKSSSFYRAEYFEWLTRDVHDIYKPSDNYRIFGTRKGELMSGYKEGEWQTISYYFETTNKKVKYISRVEYFKHGLQDSIYKILDKDGRIIYETTFKMGTGIERDYHENGQLYYEIEKQDGYFTDTLKLYNSDGKLIQKLLYNKNIIVYDEKTDDDGVITKELIGME